MGLKIKKFVAVTAMLSLLTSTGVTTLAPVISPTVNAVSTSNADTATEMKIYDMNNNEVTSNTVTYISNTECNQKDHKFTKYIETDVEGGRHNRLGLMYHEFTVKLDNPNDDLVCSSFDGKSAYEPISIRAGKTRGTYIVRVTTKKVLSTWIKSGDSYSNKFLNSSIKEGQYKLVLTTKSGNVYRTINLMVYGSIGTNTQISLDGSSTNLKVAKQKVLPDADSMSAGSTEDQTVVTNIRGAILIAGHVYNIKSKVTNTKIHNDFQYRIVKDKGSSVISDKAEISDTVLTPKKNGTCYAEVSFKDGINRYISRTTTFKEENGSSYKWLGYADLKFPQYIPIAIVKENPAKSITFKKTIGSMKKGESVKLELNKVPTYNSSEYATSATDVITWTSSDTSVISITKEGVITAKKGGTAVIRAQGENSKVYAEQSINVVVPASSVKINDTPFSVSVDSSLDITATMTPVDANEKITWTSEDTSIATVVPKGTSFGNTQTATIRGIKQGTVKIKATTVSGKEFFATVTVNPKIIADTLRLYSNNNEFSNDLNIYEGQSVKLTGSIFGKDIRVDDEIDWEVTDKNSTMTVEKSENTVKLKGLISGVATITARSKTSPKLYRTFNVNVLRNADIVMFTDKNGKKISGSRDVIKGYVLQLVPVLTSSIYGEEHDDKVVKWESSNTSIIKVSSNGVVSPVSEGTAYAIVTLASGKQAKVTVNSKVLSKIAIRGVTSSTVNIALTKKDMKQSYVALAYDSNGKKVTGLAETWSTDNKEIAEVDNKGTVTFHNNGTVKLTLKMGNRKKTVTLVVKVAMQACEVEPIPNIEYTYGKEKYNPPIVVKWGGKILKRGNDADYIVNYSNNTTIGTARATIYGKGEYTSSTVVSYKIVPRNIENYVTVKNLKNMSYTGKLVTPSDFQVYDGSKLLENGLDYSYQFKNNKVIGEASLVIKGKGYYTGTHEVKFNILPKSINTYDNIRVTLDSEIFKYTGKEIKPKVTVTVDNLTFREYNIEYINNVNVGTGTVKIVGTKNHTGYITKTFKIMQEYPNRITLPSSYTIGVGESLMLHPTADNTSFTINNGVMWSTSDQNVATITNGKVVAKKTGKTTITAKTMNNKATASSTITVVAAPTSISMNLVTPNSVVSKTLSNGSVATIIVKKGSKFTLNSSVPSGSASLSRLWTVDNSDILFYSETGSNVIFTAEQVGVTSITVKTFNNKSAVCRVTVVD